MAGAFVSEREQIIRFSFFHYSQFTQAECIRRIKLSLNTFDVVNVKVNSAEVVFNRQSFIFDSFRKCEALGESFSVDFDLEPAHRMRVGNESGETIRTEALANSEIGRNVGEDQICWSPLKRQILDFGLLKESLYLIAHEALARNPSREVGRIVKHAIISFELAKGGVLKMQLDFLDQKRLGYFYYDTF